MRSTSKPEAGVPAVLDGPPSTETFADALVGAIFPKTTARAYTAMIAIADTAMRHHVSEDGGKVYHHVAFHRTAAGASAALALMDLAGNLAGFQLYAGGRVVRYTDRTVDVLTCYLNSERCSDPDAWCHVVTDSGCVIPTTHHSIPFGVAINIRSEALTAPPPPAWMFPCRYLLHKFKIDLRHPSRPSAQIEAAAVEASCHWCPRFNPNNLRPLGEKE